MSSSFTSTREALTVTPSCAFPVQLQIPDELGRELGRMPVVPGNPGKGWSPREMATSSSGGKIDHRHIVESVRIRAGGGFVGHELPSAPRSVPFSCWMPRVTVAGKLAGLLTSWMYSGPCTVRALNPEPLPDDTGNARSAVDRAEWPDGKLPLRSEIIRGVALSVKLTATL